MKREGGMSMGIEDIISGVIGREGSDYTHHPSDRGGPTKFGPRKSLRKARYKGKYLGVNT